MKTFKPSYEYLAKIIRVVDGDTIHLLVDKGFRDYSEIICRLHGINAPELKGESREEGLKSKTRLEELLQKNTQVFIKTFKDKQDPYGRYVAQIFIDEDSRDVSTILLEENFAKAVKY